MILKIISAEKVEFEGEVQQVTLPGVVGSFQVLNDHAAIIAALAPGTMNWGEVDGAKEERSIAGGVADVKNNVVSVCIY